MLPNTRARRHRATVDDLDLDGRPRDRRAHRTSGRPRRARRTDPEPRHARTLRCIFAVIRYGASRKHTCIGHGVASNVRIRSTALSRTADFSCRQRACERPGEHRGEIVDGIRTGARWRVRLGVITAMVLVTGGAGVSITSPNPTSIADALTVHTTNATVHSSAAPLVAPVVAVVATPSGHGYWRVASDGGVLHRRRRALLRIGNAHLARRDRRHGRDIERARLLARRSARWCVHVRRRAVQGLDGRASS